LFFECAEVAGICVPGEMVEHQAGSRTGFGAGALSFLNDKKTAASLTGWFEGTS
jgi:hypothetical protein